jgi:putative glycosyltransferase (TIGR04372 family)
MHFSIHHKVLAQIGNLSKTIILSPNPAAIGNASEDYFYGLLRARREKKKLIILFPYHFPGRLKQRVIEPAIFYLESELLVWRFKSPISILFNTIWTTYFIITILAGIILAKFFKKYVKGYYYRPLAGQDVLWRPKASTMNFSWDRVRELEWDRQISNSPSLIMPKKLAQSCEVERKRMGLPKDAWYVCLHVREAGYRSDPDNFRNAEIESYILAIKEITERGGWVVRMGDATMKALPPINKVIDYPFTSSRSAIMDVYLLQECLFYIGTSSGIMDTAILLGKPIVVTNAPPLMTLPLRKDDLVIFKHAYSKTQNRRLSTREWLAGLRKITIEHFSVPDWRYIDNSAEEIRTVVVEWFDRNDDEGSDELQKEFKTIQMEILKGLSATLRLGDSEVENINEWFRHASKWVSWKGKVSPAFLKKNW